MLQLVRKSLRGLFTFVLLIGAAQAQLVYNPGAGGGGGSGTVTSVVIAGTANQITASGTCTITTSGTCTLSLPAGVAIGANGGTGGSLTLNGATSGSAALTVSVTGVLALPSGTTATSMSLTTPLLGTPTSGVLTNETGYLWNNLANGGGNLAITPGGTSIFSTTSAVSQFFAWKNTTAAVVGTSQGSPVLSTCGRAFHGSADVEDCLTLSELPGNGNDAAIAFTVGHTGSSTGTVTTTFPGPVASGTSGSLPGVIQLPGNTGSVTPTANTAGWVGPALSSFTATWYQLPSTAPSGTQSLQCGTPSSNVSACSFATVTGTPALSAVTGSAAQATGTEVGAGDNYTFAGVETTNLTAYINITDANSTNNNTNVGLMGGVTGTSTGGIGLLVYDVSGTGDIARFYSGGSVANGTYTVGTLEVEFTASGAAVFGAGTNPTTGTSGGWFAIEGTAPTGTSTNYGMYNDSTNHCPTLLRQSTNVGCAMGVNGTNTFGTAGIIDMSGATGATAFKVPVIAGATAGADGVIDYDSTNKNTHVRTNGADSIVLASAAALTTNIVPKITIASGNQIVANSSITDNVLVTSSEFVNFASNRVFMTADWTCGTGGTVSSCAAATIVGSSGTPLTLTLPLSAQSWHFHCHVVVTDTTGLPTNNWAMLTATNGATNVTASYSGFTAAAVAAAGATTDTASTTSSITIGGTWAQGATATKMPYDIDAWIESASASGTVVSLQVIDPTVADLLTIYRGAYCTVGPF